MIPFEVTAARRDERLIVNVAGELDMETAPAVAAVVDPLLVTAPAVLEFDLTDLGFIDSSGIGLLVGYFRHGNDAGFTLSLSGVDDRTRRLLQIVHLDELFNIS